MKGYRLFYNFYTSILVKRTLLVSEHIVAMNLSPRFQAVRCEVEPAPIWLCNVYAPSFGDPEKVAFYQSVIEYLEPVTMNNVILAGDFNNVLDSLLDSSHSNVEPEGSARVLRKLIDKLNLRDSFRVLHPEKVEYTNVPDAAHVGARRRLDRIYMSSQLRVDRVVFHAKPRFSTHRPYSVHLEGSPKRHKGYFILGSDITRNASLCAAIIDFPPLFMDNGNRSWDYFVSQTRRRSIQLSLCMKRLIDITESDRGIPEIENPKYQDFRVGGAGLRARFQRRTEKSLIDLKGDPIYVVHQRFAAFFAKIFEKKNTCDAQEYIAEYGPDCLTSLERYNLDATITVEELTTAFEKYSHPSSPGPDGLPFEFYNQNWNAIAPILCNTGNHIMEHGTLPESMKKIYVKLLHKGQDPTDPGNYRPISLLPVAVRILSYTLNKRFLKVADRIVGSEQKGFLPERQMQDAIHSIRNLVQYLKQRSPREAIPFEGLAFVDFQKAFDSVCHRYIAQLLDCVGMGPRFKNFLIAVTTGQTCQLYINYSIGIPFALQSGVRQGNPISPTLFVLALEPLLNELRKKVSGISFTKTIDFNIKMSVYADDVTLCLRDRSDHLITDRALTHFAKLSGLQVNRKKTQVLYTVPDKYSDTIGKAYPLSENVKYLGIRIHGIDWDEEYKKIIHRLERHFYMDLPLVTRATAINIYIFSTIYFLDAHDPMPTKYIEKLMRHVRARLKEGGNRLSTRRIHTPCRLGGLGLIDLKFQLKGKRAKWIYQTLRSDEFPYKYFRVLIQDAIALSLESLHEGKHYNAAWFLCLLYSKPNRFQSQFRPASWMTSDGIPNNLQSYLTAWFEIVRPCAKHTFKVDEMSEDRIRDYLLVGKIGKELKECPIEFQRRLPKGISEVMATLVDKRTKEIGIKIQTFHHRHSNFYRTKGNHPIIPIWAKTIQPSPIEWRKIWGQLATVHEQAPGALQPYHLFLLGSFHARLNERAIRGSRAEDRPFAARPECALCLESQESVTHILQDCPVVKIFWTVISQELEDKEMNLEKLVNGHNHNTKQLLGYNQLLSTTMFARTKRRYGSEVPRPRSDEQWYRWVTQRTKLASCWRLAEELREAS